MIYNYIKTAIRSILRNRLIAFINITGLAFSIACVLMIYLFIADELSYDKYHTNADRVYRVTRAFNSKEKQSFLHLATVAPPIGALMKNDFGEIEQMSRSRQIVSVVGLEENGEEVSFTERDLFAVEPSLFNILNITVLAGDPIEDFKKPFTVMLSESAALKYFNNTNVVGKRLRFQNSFDLVITGLYKDFPKQTHWHPDFLLSFITLENEDVYGKTNLETNWGNNAFTTYLLLSSGTDADKLSSNLPAFINKHLTLSPTSDWTSASMSTKLELQKITDVHLNSKLDNEIEINGNINNVYMMGIVGFFIILIASFNFINLSTAQATNRAKEVGLRKAVGASKAQLMLQYLSESTLIVFFSMLLGLAIANFALYWLNVFTGKSLSLLSLGDWKMIISLAAFVIGVGVLAGFYPATVLSGFKPALVLKGKSVSFKGKGLVRKGLVTTQFTISIVLIIATLISFQQLSFLNSQALGYNNDQVVSLPYYNALSEKYSSFYNEATKSRLIKNMGRSSSVPTERLLNSQGVAHVEKNNELVNTHIVFSFVSVDHDFFDTYGVELAAGRIFSKGIVTDDTLAYIVNEAAVRAIGWKSNEEGIGKDFRYGGISGKLVGVVKDFHFESLHQKVAPIIFSPLTHYRPDYLSVKIQGGDVKGGLAHLEKVWKETLPGRPFEYEFMDSKYAALYSGEQREGTLFSIASGLAIFIACLGLFGLATFNTAQRVKEVGIRKVLGASVVSILVLLSKEIIVLILIANAIAWPIGWWLMTKWLGGFAYHIDMNIFIYVLASILTIVIAIFTTSYQTIKAANGNPVDSLRSE
jgi:putative ABC transport system permease protein